MTCGTTTYFNQITKTNKHLSRHINGFMHYPFNKNLW